MLYAIGSLSETVNVYDDLSANIEPMLKVHVLPFLTSENMYLRHRATWVYGEFYEFSLNDETHVAQAVDGLYKCLFDQHLPVRFSAAVSLAKFVSNETAQNFLKP